MKLKNIKIRTQLVIGFVLIVLFVLILGVVAYIQTNELQQQTEQIYQHPLQVRTAIGTLYNDVLTIRISKRDILMARTEKEQYDAKQEIAVSSADAENQFEIINQWYLGPAADVETAFEAYVLWLDAVDADIQTALSGDVETAIENGLSDGATSQFREAMMTSIAVINTFAINKQNALFSTSVALRDTLHRQLLVLISTILLLSLFITIYILRNIRKPIDEMLEFSNRFHEGDLDARITYQAENEFGKLGSSINTMVEAIQLNMDTNKRSAEFKEMMLRIQDLDEFLLSTLLSLSQNTDAQMAAVYLLSPDKKTFEHYKSIGMGDNIKQSFGVDNLEGEFGATIFTKNYQVLEIMPDENRFEFYTVSGKFIPREIITIPIRSKRETIAIISLMNVNKFSRLALSFIKHTVVTMGTRIEGILAYNKIKEFSEILETQNRELAEQKIELSAQASELIQQNTELEVQKNQLTEVSRLKTSFLSNMSHELRTPLNSIIALSGVLNRKLLNQISQEDYSYLEIIERNGKNLLLLINDILDISRIESGHEEVDAITFNLNHLIGDIVSLIHPQANQKNIAIKQMNGDANLPITSDADKCRHILINIIGNAVKFTEKGQVVVSAQQVGDCVEIRVTDTGIGISEANLSHIFDEFRQVDSTTARRYNGTGLGLAIAKKYANMLGGSISVTSALDEGSEFTLTLPLHYEIQHDITKEENTFDYAYTMKSPVMTTPSLSREKTILLVEDNEAAIIQIRDFVQDMGIQVLTAGGAEDALSVIGRVLPDAMILDLMMPDIDGFKLLEILRNAEATAQIPVLILTAKHITKDELKFLKRNNIHQLIQKGDVDRAKLQAVISSMLFPVETANEIQKRPLPKDTKPSVLVVEDNPDNMISIKALLGDQYTLIEAADGTQGMELAQKHVPHLILMDIALPGLNGIDAFKAIRNTPSLRHIPVIALTASAMKQDRETILASGFDAFIPKPIIEKQFFNVINEVLYGK